MNTITTRLSHLPTIGNLEEQYPESFGGVGYHGNDLIIMSQLQDYHIPVNNNNKEIINGGYLHVCLQLVLSWDQCTKERLLLEGNQLRLAGR